LFPDEAVSEDVLAAGLQVELLVSAAVGVVVDGHPANVLDGLEATSRLFKIPSTIDFEKKIGDFA
jgi:hypothetical protein